MAGGYQWGRIEEYNMTTIAIIIARGGSRRVPRKNVQPFCGLPLVAWSVIAAKCSHTVDWVYLSTDDDEIADIGEEFGAQIIRRPDWPDADQVAANRPFLHAIDEIHGDFGDDYCMAQLFPTSPQRKPDDIDRGVRKWHITGGHVVGAAKRRETYIAENVRDTISRLRIANKNYKYLDPAGGLINISHPRWYKWFVERQGTDLDAVIDEAADRGEYWEQDQYFVEVEPWQVNETDTPREFEFTEQIMEHYILRGRGAEVYYEYGRSL